jgi:hypothetical protein
VRLHYRGMVRTNLDVNTDDGFGKVTRGIKAVVTEADAKLIFALGAKAAMAFVASGVLGPLKLLTYVNFGMNFRRNHNRSPQIEGQTICQKTLCPRIEDTALN